jgi:RNA polymerase sigma-70 factor (ECF subfamily)
VNPPDLQQLRDLYALHRQGLFTLALSITRRQERAEDAVHEAFLKLCTPRENGENCQSPRDAVAYVYRIVRHAAIDQVRRYWPGGNRVAVAADQPNGFCEGAIDDAEAADTIFNLPAGDAKRILGGSDDAAFDPAARSISSETAGFVADSLTRLPDEQREAIVLRIYAGLTFEQIAAVVAAPLATVTTRYRRGLARLRPCLEKLL